MSYVYPVGCLYDYIGIPKQGSNVVIWLPPFLLLSGTPLQRVPRACAHTCHTVDMPLMENYSLAFHQVRQEQSMTCQFRSWKVLSQLWIYCKENISNQGSTLH